MFGGLSRLLGRGASRSAPDLLASVASKYGDDISRSLASQYGDDAASSVLSQIGKSVSAPKAAAAARPSKIGDALVKASDTGLNAPMSLTRKGMREVGPDAGKKIGMLYDRTGVHNDSKLREIGKELTGGENSFMDEVTNSVRSNLDRGNLVDLSDLQPQIRTIRDSMDKTIRSKFDEQDPIALANSLRSAASDIRRSATPTAGDKMKAGVLDDLGREINRRIDAGVDPRYVKNAFNDTAEEFLARSRKALLSGDKQKSTAYKRLAKEISEIPEAERTIDRYRSFKRDFVDMDKIGKLSDQATGGGSFSRSVNQVPVVGPLLDSVAAQPVEAGAQKAGAAMRGLGRKFQSGEAQGALKDVGLVGAGVGGYGLLSALTNRQAEPMGMQGAMMSPGGTGQEDPAAMSQMMGGADQVQQEAEPSVGGYTRSELEDGYVAALMDNNTDAAQAIGTMLDMIDNKETAAAKQNEETGKGDAGRGILSTMLNTYEQGGGGQGIVGGNLTNLLNRVTGGAYNANAQAYTDQSKAAATQIIKAMGESGQLTDRDIERALAAIPQVTDTPEVARIKVQQLNNMLAQVN